MTACYPHDRARISLACLCASSFDAADRSASLRALLARHRLAAYAEIQQIAGCNAVHTVEARLARCLLQTCDLSGQHELVLTQESLACPTPESEIG